MKPSIGRIVQYNVSGSGWRPMLVTGVWLESGAPAMTANAPSYISGWVFQDPHDRLGNDPWETLAGVIFQVKKAVEGVDQDCWRWPPKV